MVHASWVNAQQMANAGSCWYSDPRMPRVLFWVHVESKKNTGEGGKAGRHTSNKKIAFCYLNLFMLFMIWCLFNWLINVFLFTDFHYRFSVMDLMGFWRRGRLFQRIHWLSFKVRLLLKVLLLEQVVKWLDLIATTWLRVNCPELLRYFDSTRLIYYLFLKP